MSLPEWAPRLRAARAEARRAGEPEHVAVRRAADAWLADAVAGALTLPADAGANVALNTSAYDLGRLVGAGALPGDDALGRLVEAAVGVGVPRRSALATAKSGLRAGVLKPVKLPDLDRPTRGPERRPVAPPPLPDPVPVRLPPDAVSALWGAGLSPFAELRALRWFQARAGLGEQAAGRAGDLDLARALPPAAVCPPWASSGRKTWATARPLLLPCFDARGELVALRSRWTATDWDDACGIWRERRPGDHEGAKEVSPIGPGACRGTVYACPVGRWLLRRGPDARAGDLVERPSTAATWDPTTTWSGTVHIVEGGPCWLRYAAELAAIRADGCHAARAVLGLWAGGWSEDLAARIPDGARVVLALDPDAAGAKYAAHVTTTLGGRVDLRRVPGSLGSGGSVGDGPDDRGWTGDDLEAMAVPVDLPPGPTEQAAAPARRAACEEGLTEDEVRDARARARAVAKPQDELQEDLSRWHVHQACGALLRRAYPEDGVVAFPWPGAPQEWPPGDALETVHPDAVMPPAVGVLRANWEPLWQLAGPLAPDRVCVLVGPTGRGKTAWALQVAEATAAAGHPVVYLSAELGAAELVARLLAVRAGGHVAPGKALHRPTWRDVLMGRFPRRSEDGTGGVEGACRSLAADCPALYLATPPRGSRGVAHLEALVRQAVRRHGRPPLVLVDYLQRLDGGEGEDRRLEVSRVSGALRQLARPQPEDGYPGAAVLALSSTARTNYTGSGPRLLQSFAALWRAASEDPEALVGLGKETGDTEYDASLVIALTCDPDDPEDAEDADGNTKDADDATRRTIHGRWTSNDRAAEGRIMRKGALVVAKNREGLTGTLGIGFDGAGGWWGGALALKRWRRKKEASAKQTSKPPPGQR